LPSHILLNASSSTVVSGRLHGLVGCSLEHRSLPAEFEYWCGHSWRVFHLGLSFRIGCRSAHLAYLVHQSGRKTSIIIHST
jgi:hypothetical protein